jgi:hypothetical protein
VFALVGLAIVAVIAGVLVSSGVAQEFPARTQVAFGVVTGTVCRVPVLTNLCGTGYLSADPKPNQDCTLASPFRDYAVSSPQLIGACTSDVDYDGFGNALQFTANGVLFWQREANTVYFFTGSSVYAFIQGKSELLHGGP